MLQLFLDTLSHLEFIYIDAAASDLITKFVIYRVTCFAHFESLESVSFGMLTLAHVNSSWGPPSLSIEVMCILLVQACSLH